MVKRLPSEIRDKRRRTAGDAFRRFCLSAAAAAAVLSAGIHGPFAGTERGLLWPVPVHGGCTSSFGEYRLTHFHGGVDIRTDQQEGWPVSAVADGAIVRVRREPGGYGRVLYLRLNDGRTAVYGHLIRFSRKLGVEQALMKACARKQTSFPGNVEFNPPIPVKRGEVVAYSGELGIGYPHLHFEVRRGYDLLDPFLQGLPLPAGITAPRIWGVVFVPRDARGRVDGGVSPLLVRAVKRENGYVLSAPVSISGRVDAELVAEDHLGVASNATGVPLIRASLDGRTFYSMDLSRISLARYKESPDVFDPGWGPGGYMAYRLRKLPDLGVHGIEGEGLPSNAVPGVRNLRIIAENRAGQRSVLSGKLRYGRWGDKGAVVRLALPGSGYRLVSRRIVPAGLLLDLRRTDVSGMTPVLADGRPVQGLVVHVLDKNRVKALIPAESLAHRAQYIKVGSMNEPWCVGTGPVRLERDGWVLNLAAGAVGIIEPHGGNEARLDAGPFPVAGRCSVSFEGKRVGPGWGLFGPGRRNFLAPLDQLPVRFRTSGFYRLKQDTTPPRWGRPSFHVIPHLDEKEARLRLYDSGSGPDLYSLRLFMDGKRIYPDWDPTIRCLRIDLTGVKPGHHVLTGTCRDKCGNLANLKSRSFTLK